MIKKYFYHSDTIRCEVTKSKLVTNGIRLILQVKKDYWLFKGWEQEWYALHISETEDLPSDHRINPDIGYWPGYYGKSEKWAFGTLDCKCRIDSHMAEYVAIIESNKRAKEQLNRIFDTL